VNLTLAALMTMTLLSSCSVRQFYPLAGSVAGGAAGALGGPVTAGLGAGAGWSAGEIAKGNEDLEDAQETIQALSTGDVQALVDKGMNAHKSSFDQFVEKIQRILFIAGLCLIAYLAIPIFVARKCTKDEVGKALTRNPFPTKDT